MAEVQAPGQKCKAHTALDEIDEKGNFRRTDAGYTHIVEEGGQFPPRAGRYHLYIALACPWADGCLAVLFMKGLDHVISYSITHPTWARTRPDDPEDEHCGWQFRNPGDPPLPNTNGHGANQCDDALIPDPVFGASSVRDIYEKAGDLVGKYTTPLLFDKETGTIVSNESKVILRILNFSFNGLATNPLLNLFPEGQVEEIQRLDDIIYPNINNGVYRCGFATTQEAYEAAFTELFDALDYCEKLLSTQRYLTGKHVTWIDLRLFMTLIRFDAVYFVYFKCNKKLIREYPNLSEYCRDMYQLPEMSRAINMDHIKTHYFTSHPKLNAYGIIPRGVEEDFNAPHMRATL
mmetsp:Transcript_142895/g.249267  ORF Transcript_142895/g.249267 Transcript_142895/m.249267 type:complete len:348 (-) Transcript_142895:308-1351(-)